MSHAFTTIATFTEVIARVLAEYQIDSKKLFTGLGLPAEPFKDPDSRISIPVMKQMWHEVEKLTGNPCIGFEVGMQFHATNFHAVGYAWLASATLREGLERLVRYQRLVSTGADLDLLVSENIVEFHLTGADVVRLGYDAGFCATLQICRELSYPEFAPLSVHMMTPEPVCSKRLAEFFRCPIHYSAGSDKICFSAASVDEQLTRNNPAVVQASEEVARNYIAHMDQNDIVTKARILVINQLPDGEPSRARVCDSLHMSERTLARRLAERDYTFTSLVDEVRNQLAMDYLRQSRYSIMDVAFLLGFTDQSNFARAFKRWSGKSPSEFRLAS